MIANWIEHFARVGSSDSRLDIEAEPVAFYLTGALMGLLGWWNTAGRKKPAAEMNELFQRLTRNGLTAFIDK